MGKQKSRSSRVSNGGRTKANKAQEAKRQAKFAAKREAGNAYKYEPIKAKKGTRAWYAEKLERAEKAKSSRLPYARLTSIFAKLNNEIAKEKEAAVKAKSVKKENKTA